MYKEVFKLCIPSQEAKPAAPLGPMLGQRGIPLKPFCDMFNSISKKYKKGIPLNTHVFVLKNGNYQISIAHVSLNKQIGLLSSKSSIDCRVLYHISMELSNGNNNKVYSLYKSILSTCKRSNITLI